MVAILRDEELDGQSDKAVELDTYHEDCLLVASLHTYDLYR